MEFFDDMDRGCVHYNGTRINMVIDDNCRAWFDLAVVASLLKTTDQLRSMGLGDQIKQRKAIKAGGQCSESQRIESEHTEARLISSGHPDLAEAIAAVMRPNEEENDSNKMYISEGGICRMGIDSGKGESDFAMWMFTEVAPSISQYIRHRTIRDNEKKIAVLSGTLETLRKENAKSVRQKARLTKAQSRSKPRK